MEILILILVFLCFGTIMCFVAPILLLFEKKKISTCPSCGAASGGISGHNLEKVTAKANFYSTNMDEYKITYYFKCGKCGNTQEVVERAIVRYKLNSQVVEKIRDIAAQKWGIIGMDIPLYKIEIDD